MNPAEIAFQVVAFLFAICVHESAHAWTANRCGDPTARMLGRVTLNPLKHIDPVGTILLPAIALISNFPVIGWAKPVPVNPQNFPNQVRDDILTSVAGPISNLLVAAASVAGLAVISMTSGQGKAIVSVLALSYGNAMGAMADVSSVLVPIAGLLYFVMFINVLLAAFNLIPVPPLDGSHVLRHLLPDQARRVYDTVGMFGLILLFVAGQGVISAVVTPFLRFFNSMLMSF
jgi:Zn-dependent protease